MPTTQAKAPRRKQQPLTPERALIIIKSIHPVLVPGSSGADHMRPIYNLLTCALSSPAWDSMYADQVDRDDLSCALERMDTIYQRLEIELSGKVVK